jgi:hypothetical protein
LPYSSRQEEPAIPTSSLIQILREDLSACATELSSYIPLPSVERHIDLLIKTLKYFSLFKIIIIKITLNKEKNPHNILNLTIKIKRFDAN